MDWNKKVHGNMEKILVVNGERSGKVGRNSKEGAELKEGRGCEERAQ